MFGGEKKITVYNLHSVQVSAMATTAYHPFGEGLAADLLLYES